MSRNRKVPIYAVALVVLAITSGAVYAAEEADFDAADRELVVRLAPPPAGPAPEDLVEAVRERQPPAGALGAGDPIDARFGITGRARGAALEALLADPDRPRARLHRWVVLTYAEGTDLAAVERELGDDPQVEIVERNSRGTFSAVTPDDPYHPLQWGSFSLNLPEAWERTKGHGFVGLIDTGLDVDHEDLRVDYSSGSYNGGNFRPHLSWDFARPSTCITNPGGCVDEGEAGDPTNFNGRGHGTHVSGIVGATANNLDGVTGNCWGCGILMARSTLPQSQVADALRWLADHGAQVVSMSFGWPTVQSMVADAIDDVNERDLILAAAVGNDLSDIEFPAFDPDVIAVGGTEPPAGTVDFWERDPCPFAPSTFECGSNYTVTPGSPMIELVAPAADVLSTFYVGGSWNAPLGCHDGGFGPGGYDYCTGTSMSSPNAASVAALVRSINPLLSEQDVRTILRDAASGNGAWDSHLGYGLPDAAAAADAILGTTAGEVLANRLTPLFVLYSFDAEAHLETTVPQRASAAILDPETDYDSWSALAPLVRGYGVFPGAPCQISPCTREPVAWAYLFSTDSEPFTGSPELVPLYRLSYDQEFGGNPANQSFVYTTEAAGVKHFADLEYRLDGIEGYIFKRCTPEPSCIPFGATRLYRMYHFDRDDYVVIPESKVTFFQGEGYVFQTGLNDWIGYVYENVDTDGDELIDGFELLAGTDPALADSDCDGISDGDEVNRFPYGDPLDALCGSIEADPEVLIVPQGQLGSTMVSWSTTGTPTAEVWVKIDSGTETLMARAPSGSGTAPWIQRNRAYEFLLFAGVQREELLDYVTVFGLAAGGGQVSAYPRPVPVVPGSLGTTTVSWATNGMGTAEVWVSMNGGAEKLMARAASGSWSAGWIQHGKTYVFRLYAGTAHAVLLDSITVVGVSP